MKLKTQFPFLLILLFSCFYFVQAQNKNTVQKIKYIDKANMDLSIKQGDDFYLYANSGWIKAHPVPASKTRWGSFDMLREESSKRLQILLEDAVKTKNPDRKTQIIADLYTSGMDSIAIEKKDYAPIKGILDEIKSINSVHDLLHEMAVLRTIGYNSGGVGAFVGVDRKNVNKYIPSIGQGGTTLPDRDYYLKDDPRSVKIREAYKIYIQKLFSLIGYDANTAAANAASILKIETALAKAQYSRVEMRDPYKTYNKFAVAEVSSLTSNINWSEQLSDAKIMGADSIVVSNPSFLKTYNDMLVSVPLSEWKIYVAWNVLNGSAGSLSSPFVNADFEFTKALTGQKEQTPRWQRMSNLIDRVVSDFIGELYVEKYFKQPAKDYMVNLVNNMQSTFGDRIKKLDWMSEATKQKALEKLFAITKKIAYPDKWKTYDGLVISKDDYFENLRQCSIWHYNDRVNKMGKPVDKTEWGMTPPTINAQYSPSNNDITFPAGILQFPFFDFGADDAINYGGIAAVIGHEMTHGFDDQGRQFAADGNLKDWWTKEDAEKFKVKADEVVKQYNAATVLDTIHVNGKLTLGENLADLGGLSIAYEAFSKTKQFKEGKKIDGFTPQQRFFLSFAQIWRNNTLPETAENLIKTDPHSPGQYRATIPAQNMDAWYKAFNIKEGDKLFIPKEKRVTIW